MMRQELVALTASLALAWCDPANAQGIERFLQPERSKAAVVPEQFALTKRIGNQRPVGQLIFRCFSQSPTEPFDLRLEIESWKRAAPTPCNPYRRSGALCVQERGSLAYEVQLDQQSAKRLEAIKRYERPAESTTTDVSKMLTVLSIEVSRDLLAQLRQARQITITSLWLKESVTFDLTDFPVLFANQMRAEKCRE